MKFLHTDKAPAAIGPYSQGVKAGKTLYTSGQLPYVGGELETDPALATRASLDNVLHIVKAGGGSKESIVKCVIYATDVAHFEQINAAYAAFFGEHKPARSFVEVSALAKGAVLEIEAIAHL